MAAWRKEFFAAILLRFVFFSCVCHWVFWHGCVSEMGRRPELTRGQCEKAGLGPKETRRSRNFLALAVFVTGPWRHAWFESSGEGVRAALWSNKRLRNWKVAN